jgi:hypothetical protein
MITSPYLAAVSLYWAVSVILFYGVMVWWMFSDGECDEDPRWKVLAALPSPRREFTILAAAIICVFLAPVLFPVCVIRCVRDGLAERAEMKALLRSHRENVYKPLRLGQLPDIARLYFEESTPELLGLGFTEVGTFLLKPEPAKSYGRCFQSPDGLALGVLGQMLSSTYYSFSTLFSNGLVLETASVEASRDLLEINTSKSYRAVFSPNATLAETYARHLQEIDVLQNSIPAYALAFRPDQFDEILTYEGRVYSRELFAMGKKDAPLANPVLPEPLPPDDLPLHEPAPATTDAC